MVRLSTMLYVTKDSVATNEITEEFIKSCNVPLVIQELLDNDQSTIEINGFNIELLIGEIEEYMISMLMERGMCAGLIYCGGMNLEHTTPYDLMNMGGTIQYKHQKYDGDFTAQALANPTEFEVVGLQSVDGVIMAEVVDSDSTTNVLTMNTPVNPEMYS